MKPSRELFCAEYLKDFNGTQAAIRAGYKPHTAKQAGSRMLTFVDVKKRISELSAEILKRPVEDLKLRIRNELEQIGFADTTEILNDFGDIDVKQLKKFGAVVGSVKNGKDGLEVKFHSKIAALELLARYAGFVEESKQTITVSGGKVIVTIDAGRPHSEDAEDGS